MAGRTFVIQRDTDVSGVSGTGIVADGIMWPDGMCTVHWRGKYPTDNTHLSMFSVEFIHCHQGASRIVWDDDTPLVNLCKECGNTVDSVLYCVHCRTYPQVLSNASGQLRSSPVVKEKG